MFVFLSFSKYDEH